MVDYVGKHGAEEQRETVGSLNGERDCKWRSAWILCRAACSAVSLEKEGQFAADTKLFETVKTKAGFKGVHENHMILKGIKAVYRLGRENNLNVWSLFSKIIKYRYLFYVSVLLPKVHQRYDLDGDASMAKVSTYLFWIIYLSWIMILKWKLPNFQINDVNKAILVC